MPADGDPHGLGAAGCALLVLSEALDQLVRPEPFLLALAALGQRSRTLLIGFCELQRGAAPASARALPRPLVEANILIRFLAKAPDLHTELWETEAERTSSRSRENPRRRRRWPRAGRHIRST